MREESHLARVRPPPRLSGILETSLYVDELDQATRFYQELFAFPLIVGDDRIRALSIAGPQLLLLFKRGASVDHDPPHDGRGPVHLAFAIPASELPAWRQRLQERGIQIESIKTWERGGTSLYFRDPDGHLLELATPGVWAVY